MDVEPVYAQWKLGRFPTEELPAFARDLMVAGWGAQEICRWMHWTRHCFREEDPAMCRCLEFAFRALDYDGS